MAQSFTALGAGNGFPVCLSEITIGGTNPTISLGNTTTLEQMSAYWNFDNMSWGGASFDPNNQPKDLICNPNANAGSDTVYTQGSEEAYQVTNNNPFIILDGNSRYYSHGLQFVYYDVAYPTSGNAGVYYSELAYVGGSYVNHSDPYECFTIYRTPSPHAPPYAYGKSAGKTTVTKTNATISGVPFTRLFTQSWYEETGGDVCPTENSSNFPSVPSGLPTLNFHTY